MNHQLIIGAGGTGKSYECNKKIEDNPYFCYRTSTTGVSALNMLGDSIIEGNTLKTGGGKTINSALGFSDYKDLIRQFKNGAHGIKRNLKKISEYYERIAIDEVFMLNSFTLDMIYQCIEEHNNNINNNPIYLYMMGDIGQLKPVEGAPLFNANCWNTINKVYLTKVYRQSNTDFINVLNEIRRGNIKDTIPWLENNINYTDRLLEDYPGITVMTTNKAVDTFNTKKLKKLNKHIVQYRPTKEGNPGTLWNTLNRTTFLCEGARVMITCNNLAQGYANGSLGIIESLGADKILVKLDADNSIVTIKNITNYNIDINGKELGSVTYLPVRLAWATTLYKLQGLTIKGKLQAKVKGDKFLRTLHGGLYTLLSRMVNPEDILIVGNLDDLVSSCFVDPTLKKYIK
jgi:hypothetical protein